MEALKNKHGYISRFESPVFGGYAEFAAILLATSRQSRVSLGRSLSAVFLAIIDE
jgi:hypothetical protein